MLLETMKHNLLKNNLRPALRDQVIHCVPLTLEDVIKNVTFLEEQALGISREKIKQWEQQHVRNQDAVECMTRAMDKMPISVANALNYYRTYQRPAQRPNTADRNRQGPRDGNTAPTQCYKCRQFGHKAVDCRVNPGVINYVEGYGIEQDTYGDNIPSTPEAYISATGGQTGPLQRTPSIRTPWSKEGIQAAVLEPQLGPQLDPLQPLQNPHFL